VPKLPQGIAKFDSAAAMTQALARFLDGRDFAGLGQPAPMQWATRLADWLPRHARERVFAHLGANEAVSRDKVGTVDMEQVAEWVVALYPRRRYPAVMIGSSNGALTHIGAALGIPWLGQTFLTLVTQKHVDPDDPGHAMESELETAEQFLATNRYSQLHHMHDPNQDRLMLGLITYFRSKYLRLPPAYRRFVTDSLAADGTIYVVECNNRWPTRRVAERHYFQFGAEGGARREEYFDGSDRVAASLERYQSSVRRWHPPEPDGESPEAEWGFEPALGEDILRLARARGHRVVRILFDEPMQVSGLVADFYRDWYRQRGMAANRLIIESFILLDPMAALRTGSVPLWMVFNTEVSLAFAERYLDGAEPFDEIYLMLFAHGAESVGLPSIDRWRAVFERARQTGAFLGLEPSTYPAHFAHFARYTQSLLKRVPARHPVPPPLPLTRFERYVETHGDRYGVRLVEAS
jgi:hypothetical protein